MTCERHPWNNWQAGPCITCANEAHIVLTEDVAAEREAHWAKAKGRMMASVEERKRRAKLASEASAIVRRERSLRAGMASAEATAARKEVAL